MMSVATSQIILFEAIIQRRPLSTTPPPSWPRPRPSYVDAVFSIPSIWSEAVIRRATTDGCPSASVASILQLQSVLSNQQQSIEKRFVQILLNLLPINLAQTYTTRDDNALQIFVQASESASINRA